MMQLETDSRDQVNDLSGAVESAEKVKARAPFEAKGYYNLQWMYAVRSDFDSAERINLMLSVPNSVTDVFRAVS